MTALVNTPVADLPAASSVAGTEKFYADTGSRDVYVTADQIKAFASSGVEGGLAAEIIARQEAIDGEAAVRAAADTTLQTNITAEASTRAAADTTLTTNLNSEIANRRLVDRSMQSTLTEAASLVFTTAASRHVTNALDTFYKRLVDAGISTKFDFLYCHGLHATQPGLVNLLNPGTYTLTNTGPLVQTPGGFFQGDGTNSLSLGVAHSSLAKCLQDDNFAFVWSLSDVNDTGVDLGQATGGRLRIECRNSGNMRVRNSAGAIDTLAVSDSLGMFWTARNNSADYLMGQNKGAGTTKTQASTGRSGGNMLIFAGDAGTPSTRKLFASGAGSYLNQTEREALYDALLELQGLLRIQYPSVSSVTWQDVPRSVIHVPNTSRFDRLPYMVDRETVFTQGHTAANDGYAGEWLYDKSSVASADGETIIAAPTVAGGRLHRLTLASKWFPDIATMKAFSGTLREGAVVKVRGYNSGSAKGGGRFVYLAADAAADDDDVEVFELASGQKVRRIVGAEGLTFYDAGAVGDGVVTVTGSTYDVTGTDDTTVINRYFAWFASKLDGDASAAVAIAKFGAGVFVCDGSVGMASQRNTARWTAIGYGTVIASRAAGKIAVDFTDTRNGHIDGLTIVGDTSSAPAVGLQLCRINGVVEQWKLNRVFTFGHFIYTGIYNDGAERFMATDCEGQNEYNGQHAYGWAQDSHRFLRYDAPKTITGVTNANPAVITITAHGYVTGDKVYTEAVVGATGINTQKHTITRIDANTFSVPVAAGGAYVSGGIAFKERWSSDLINHASDIERPWIGNGMFLQIIQNCSARSRYGFAALLETIKGHHNYSGMFVACGMKERAASSDVACTSVVAGLVTTGAVHNLSVGHYFYLKSTDVPASNERVLLVATTPTTTTFTFTHIDGSVVTLTDSLGGFVRRIDPESGYGTHFLLGGDGTAGNLEGCVYDVHHEGGQSDADPKAYGFIQNLSTLRAGTGTAAVVMDGVRIHEQAWHGLFGGFQVDGTTVSAVQFSGQIIANRFSPTFGDGNPNNKLLLGASNWTVCGDLYLGNTAVLSPNVTYKGAIYNIAAGTMSYILPAQEFVMTAGSKVGATAGWTVNDTVDSAQLGLLPASQTGSTLVVPISGLRAGDVITGFFLTGELASAGNTVTVDADFFKQEATAGTVTNTNLASLTQISKTADYLFNKDTTNGTKTLGSAETVTAAKTYFVRVTGTTGALCNVRLLGVGAIVTRTM